MTVMLNSPSPSFTQQQEFNHDNIKHNDSSPGKYTKQTYNILPKICECLSSIVSYIHKCITRFITNLNAFISRVIPTKNYSLQGLTELIQNSNNNNKHEVQTALKYFININPSHFLQNEQLNITNEDGFNLLHLAILNNNIDAVKKISLYNLIDFNYKTPNLESIMHLAVINNNLKMVKLLNSNKIKHNTNILEQNVNGRTPLHFAVLSGKKNIAVELFKTLNPTEFSDAVLLEDQWHNSILDYAYYHTRENSQGLKYSELEKCMQIAFIKMDKKSLNTILINELYSDHQDIIKTILRLGRIDLSEKDDGGISPLMHAMLSENYRALSCFADYQKNTVKTFKEKILAHIPIDFQLKHMPIMMYFMVAANLKLENTNYALKNNPNVVFSFVNVNPYMFQYVSYRLKQDYDFIKKSVGNNPNILEFVNHEIQLRHPKIVKKALSKINSLIKFIPEKLITQIIYSIPSCLFNLTNKKINTLIKNNDELLKFLVANRYINDEQISENGLNSKVAELFSEKNLQQIPNNVHYVWFGRLPEKYINNLSKAALQFQGRKLYLWTDKSNFHYNLKLLDEYGLNNSIEVKCFENFVTEQSQLNNEHFDSSIWKKVSGAFYRELNGSFANYVAASNIARIMLLNQMGGEYFDIDIEFNDSPKIKKPKKTDIEFNDFPQIREPEKITASAIKKQPLRTANGTILNKFGGIHKWMASIPFSSFTKKTLKKISKYYHTEDSLWYEKRSDNDLRLKGTMEYTGVGLVSSVFLNTDTRKLESHYQYCKNINTHCKPNSNASDTQSIIVPDNKKRASEAPF